MRKSLPAGATKRNEFGARIRRIRTERKLTLDELSKLTRIPVSTLSRVEKRAEDLSCWDPNAVWRCAISRPVCCSCEDKRGHRLESIVCRGRSASSPSVTLSDVLAGTTDCSITTVEFLGSDRRNSDQRPTTGPAV